MLEKRIKSFKDAWKGMLLLFKNEVHAKIHFSAAIITIIAGLYFEVSSLEWMVIVLTIFMVIAMEGLNTAIEKLTDMVSPNYSEQAGKVKDLAAGAVLLSAIGALIVGLIIFSPKLLSLITNSL